MNIDQSENECDGKNKENYRSFIVFFIVEGIIIGIVAAMLSVVIIGLSYNVVAEKMLTSSASDLLNFQLLGFNELFDLIIVVYLVLGVGVGVIGSVISMRKYLKV